MSRAPARKWERVWYWLTVFADSDSHDVTRREEAVGELMVWLAKWPNARSRVETALAATVTRSVKARLASDRLTLDERRGAARAMADLVAREARLRRVYALQRKRLEKKFTQDWLSRRIAEELPDIFRAVLGGGGKR